MTRKAQMTKWGNSLAVRIPKSIAETAKLRKGDALEIVVRRPGAVEIRSARRKPTLRELVSAITPENRHEETDWGAPQGKEMW